MNKVVALNKNLPASVAGLASGLANSVARAPSGGQLYMRFTKFGEWMYGAGGTEVEEGSTWAISPVLLGHGWVAWGDKAHGTEGESLGEVLVPAGEDMPAQPEPVAGQWVEARSMTMVCVSGEDTGTQVLFKTNSKGGVSAYNDLVTAVVRRIEAGEAAIVPIVELSSGAYEHASYGKIFTPELSIIDWATLDATAVDDTEGDTEEEEEEEEKQAPRKRRRRSS